MKERIQKVLAEAGVESRRHVEEMVLQGRIAVNGEVVRKLPVMIEPGVDKISIDDEPIRIDRRLGQEKVYLLMNKPRGVYCTNVAQGEQKRCIDLLPPDFQKRVYPVGRLDAESRGLLLLTNDGDLTQRLTHPKFGVPKTYTAVVDGFLTPETVTALSEGIWLADPKKGGFKTGRSKIKVIRRSAKQSVLEITIREGRNRQVRRMLAKIGHKVRDLTRIKMGPLALEGLKVGAIRSLRPKELAALIEATRGDGHEETPAGDGTKRGSFAATETGTKPRRAERSDHREPGERSSGASRSGAGRAGAGRAVGARAGGSRSGGPRSDASRPGGRSSSPRPNRSPRSDK